MDRYVVGHEQVKQALLLGLVAREHIYIEGPPGTAKTMLAEITAAAANVAFYFYQFHRDTRLAELVGDMRIAREQTADGAELISQSIVKGGILTAALCVLDDISRAPGEALNVLLRILNERQFQHEAIPLLCAIATSNPTTDDYYNEPLDPANLDRFTIQVSSQGLVYEQAWEEVRQVIDRYAGATLSEDITPAAILDRPQLDRGYDLLHRVLVPDPVKATLIRVLSRLVEHYKLDPSSALISDRSFLVKAVKLLKAGALLRGKTVVSLEDLSLLAYLTAFRLPPDIHRAMPQIVRESIEFSAGGST